ncbi:BgTH12-06027 [Blumeria graminis f. sp. triticale]|uniref:Bgt-20812 n=3 Tax=Blumeria graminis TaxID=34373 RepID=A0A9X9QEK0_BLUGR|nr:BgTH12-06027 [Blumeria graminis f. sp. triticale]VDB91104.1 Bgt-20812 [Blumeria graminis f. sp. tritici]
MLAFPYSAALHVICHGTCRGNASTDIPRNQKFGPHWPPYRSRAYSPCSIPRHWVNSEIFGHHIIPASLFSPQSHVKSCRGMPHSHRRSPFSMGILGQDNKTVLIRPSRNVRCCTFEPLKL